MFKVKKVVFCLLVCLIASYAFAMSPKEDGLYNGVTNLHYKPYVAFPDEGLDTYLFYNPSALASEDFLISFPSFNVTSYNMAKSLESSSFAKALSDMTKFKFTKAGLISYLTVLADSAGSGYSNVISGDLGFGFVLNSFAFGVHGMINIHSMPKSDDSETQELLGTNFVPELLYGISVGYGYRIADTNSFTFDVGGVIHLNRKSYVMSIDVNTLVKLINKSTELDVLPARGGFGFPIDLNASMGFFNEKLKLNLNINGLNGVYYMYNYPSIRDAMAFSDGSDFYVMYAPFDVSLNASYTPEFKIANPTFYLGIDDIVAYLRDDIKKENPGLEFIKHLNLRLKINIYDIAVINLAYSMGYPQLGLSLGYVGNKIEFVYGYKEAGAGYGQKPVDFFTVRFRFGYTPNEL